MERGKMKSIGLLAGIAVLIAAAGIFWRTKDRCIDLPPCEQYRCRYPNFYCKGVLHESATRPDSIGDARRIVSEYLQSMNREATVITATKWPDPYNWYQLTSRYEDGSEEGFEIGPDGSIYEIKRLK